MNQAAAASERFRPVRETIRQQMTELAVPGLAVAVAQGGRIVWEEGFGLADRERRRAATEHTAFPIASVTKPMTATAIMRLVELGKLDLDMPANDYLPEDCRLKVWVGNPDELTVRRLANHTAGLTTCSNEYQPNDRVPMPSQEDSIRRYGQAVTMPGERYRYANFGYGVLDYLVARVSGRSYAEFMHREVFAPLGMNHSAMGVPDHLADVAATRYDQEQQPIPNYPTNHAGASAAFACVHDLVRFGLFHLKRPLPDQKRILSDAAVDAMQMPTARMGATDPRDRNLRPESWYGVGWVIDSEESPRRVSHGGGLDGCAAKLLLLPDEQIVIAVASNIFKPLAYRLEDDILEALLPAYRRPTVRPPFPAAGKPDASNLAPLRGDWSGQIHTYEGPMPMTLSFRECGHVTTKVGNLQPPTLVNEVQFEDGWLKGTLAGMIETADASRKPRYPIHHLQLDLKLRGDRLTGAVICVAGVTLGHWVELRRTPE